jgi:hypothetical protein
VKPPPPSSLPGQRGAALIVGLIMLVLITLAVTAGFTLSNTNLKSVGNMQNRNEAVAAANRAIEQVASSLLLPGANGSPSLAMPQATESRVDIDNDGTVDYTVQVAAPTCVRATRSTETGGGGLGIGGIGGGGSSAGAGLDALPEQYNAVWDISTSVTHAASGTTTAVRQGVRTLLTKEQFQALCAI